MKHIEPDKLNQLLEIISPAPALRIAHFSDGGEKMVELLEDFCSQNTYEYQINATDSSFFERLQQNYKESPTVKSMNFSLERPRYMLQGKLYEYLFVTSTIPTEMRSDFLKKAHSMIKNAGMILIFLPKGERTQYYEWIALLEEHYYVASSIIDDLFKYYDVIVSKKMHGWGG
jgi:hypothetical protein